MVSETMGAFVVEVLKLEAAWVFVLQTASQQNRCWLLERDVRGIMGGLGRHVVSQILTANL